jgi:hypothetical protein
MKYWRNMKTLSWSLRVDWVGVGFMGKGKRAGSEGSGKAATAPRR